MLIRPRNLRTLVDHIPTLPRSHPSTLRQVRNVANKRTLQAGALGWGLVIAAQMYSVVRTHDGAVLVPWWIVVIIMSLLKWAFYVLMKTSLLANARDLYQMNKAKA